MDGRFVDESVRGQKYVMACGFVDGRDLAIIRGDVRSLLQPGQRRIHSMSISAARTSRAVSAMLRNGRHERERHQSQSILRKNAINATDTLAMIIATVTHDLSPGSPLMFMP